MGSQPEKGCIKCSIVKKKHLWEIAIAAEQFSQDITIYFYFCKKIRSLKAHFINLNFQDHTLTSCPKRKCPSNLDPLQPIESHVFRRGFCCPSSSPTPNKLTFPGHFPPTTRGIIDPPNSRVRCALWNVTRRAGPPTSHARSSLTPPQRSPSSRPQPVAPPRPTSQPWKRISSPKSGFARSLQ